MCINPLTITCIVDMEESPAPQNLADSPLPGIASTSSHMRPNTCAAAYECFYDDRTMRSSALWGNGQLH